LGIDDVKTIEKITNLLLDRLPPPQYNPEQAFYGMKEKKIERESD
jgi:hypothetical protein